MTFSQSQIKTGKAIVTITWLLVFASGLFPTLIPFSNVFMGIGAFLVVAHLIEIVVFKKRLNVFNDYIGVFFYGALHLNQLAINYKNSKR